MQQSSTLPERENSVWRLSHEGSELFLAGSGSTSCTMAVAVFFLLANQSALAKLEDEVRAVMPDINVIPPVKVLEELPWLVSFSPNTSPAIAA